MGRRAMLLGALVLVLGCESRPPAAKANPALPPEAPENVLDAELKQFLDGMLVTSSIDPPADLVWPAVAMQGSLSYRVMGSAEKYGFKRFEDLKALYTVPLAETGRWHAWVADRAENWPRVLQVYQHLWTQDPRDIEAAYQVGLKTYLLWGPKEALARLARVDVRTLEARDPRSSVPRARFEERRCQYAYRAGKLAQARAYCNAAQALDDEYGARYLAKTFLALGKYPEGLAAAELAARTPRAAKEPGTFLVLGLAQHLSGKAEAARATWSVARAKWPDYQPLGAALAGRVTTEREGEREEQAAAAEQDATRLASCGYVLAELGLPEQSEACYAGADRLQKGPALAHRLVFLARTDLPGAVARLEAAVKEDPQPILRSALASLLLRQGRNPEARVLAEQVLAERPIDTKAMGVMWEACGNLHDYPCLIDYRKRLGMPTHFNVEQYRDVSRALREQAEKNGEGLAAAEGASTSAPVPPPLRAITLVPLANRVPPELEGLDAQLGAMFPGLTITLAPREDAAGLVKPDQGWVSWERLSDRLREQPGQLYVVEEDLIVGERKYAFAQVDLVHGRGVASLSRLRSPSGFPVAGWRAVDTTILPAVQARARQLLASAVGKLAGLSFPCPQQGCPMREARTVKDLGVAQGALCPKHLAELKARLAAAR